MTTRAPSDSASLAVPSVLPPSQTKISSGAPPSAANVAGSDAAAFSVGSTTESIR
jgi:hypothetical protein